MLKVSGIGKFHRNKLFLCYIWYLFIFRFEVMADFQYLVPDLPDVLKQVTDGAVLNQDVPYHLQPPVFTRFDHPINYNYNAESAPRGNKTDQGNEKDEER